MRIPAKQERYAALKEIDTAVVDTLAREYRGEKVTLDSLEAWEGRREGYKQLVDDAKHVLHDLRSKLMRDRILDDGVRIDGRSTTEVRAIACEVSVVPRAHGTGLFTRGETQALVYATLGSADDEQTIDALTERYDKQFLLHYNFPPFSVGEARPLRGPGRREVGHGALDCTKGHRAH